MFEFVLKFYQTIQVLRQNDAQINFKALFFKKKSAANATLLNL